LHFLLSEGNHGDICTEQELLESFDLTSKLIFTDKGYDSDKVKERGGMAVIPSRITAKHPREREIDWFIYRARHLIENLFLKLKNSRKFATRYEKKAVYTFIACIFL